MSDKTLFNLLDAGKTEEEIAHEVMEKFDRETDELGEPDYAAEKEQDLDN